MMNLLKVLAIKPLAGLVAVALLAGSCTNIYFDRPVPQNGVTMKQIPDDWTGVYTSRMAGQEEMSPLEQIFQQCFRLERLDDNQLLVSTEYRIHEKDMPAFREALAQQKNEGNMLDYQLTETYLMYVLKPENNDAGVAVERQYTTMVRKGSWYLFPQTMAPYRLFQLADGRQTEFNRERVPHLQSEWLPGSDSVSVKESELVARQKGDAWYFNTREGKDAKWSLLCVRQVSKDQLLVKMSNVEDSRDFEQRLDYFNAITPFRKTDNNHYEINPTDEALDRLLAEERLFQTARLQRIE